MQRVGLLCFICFFFVGCSFRTDPKPSVLIIAVEGLGFDSVSCEAAGFQTFCEESVRFTHAFTPSTMTQATLASILTGRYPYEHGVASNGPDFLSAKFETVPEVAVQKGYRTAFFSGGPPIWRKSGLAQGFETFDDFFMIHFHRMYRPARETSERFIDWLNTEVDEKAFFATLFWPDLQFPDVTTKNDLGEIRERTYQGQLRAVGDSLQYVIQNLQRLKRWDNTFVILVGTNGHLARFRDLETESLSLLSNNTQVALYIKPARKPRDAGVEWKIDRNVTLVDLAPTLMDILGGPKKTIDDDDLQVVSLKAVLYRPYVDWKAERPLLTETAWPLWRNWGSTRWSLRIDPYLFIYDTQPQLYNTLTDRMELMPAPKQDFQGREMTNRFSLEMQKLGFAAWVPPLPRKIEKLLLGERLWRELDVTSDLYRELDRLIMRLPNEEQLLGWKAQLLLGIGDWRGLADLGIRARKPLWRYVGERNLNLRGNLNREGCAKLFLEKRDEVLRPEECEDELLMSLWRWIHEKDSSEKKVLQEVFLRHYMQQKTLERIAKVNYVNALKWDVLVDLPGEPKRADLLLSMPENKRFQSITKNRMLREDQGFDLSSSFEF